MLGVRKYTKILLVNFTTLRCNLREGSIFSKAPDLSARSNFKCLYLKLLKMEMVTSSAEFFNLKHGRQWQCDTKCVCTFQFVAHPNCQQAVLAKFYGPQAFLRDQTATYKFLYLLLMILGFPFLSLVYLYLPIKRVKDFIGCS